MSSFEVAVSVGAEIIRFLVMVNFCRAPLAGSMTSAPVEGIVIDVHVCVCVPPPAIDPQEVPLEVFIRTSP